MKTEALIGDLCSDSTPEKKLCCPLRSVLLGLGSVALYLTAFFAVMGVRADIAGKTTYMPYVLEVGFCALTLACAIVSASWQAFPDLAERRMVTWFPAIPLFGFFASLGLEYAITPGGSVEFVAGVTCAMHMCLIALLPTALLYFTLARGVFVHATRASTHVGLAAAMTAYLAARVAEPTDDMLHLLAWHLLPTFAFILLMGGIHRWLIRGRKV